MCEEKIDFVVTWVDENDQGWRKEYCKWSVKVDGDKRSIRFRDWGTLRYQFRAFEKFTPWVNKVYFITYGHLPPWLNVSHPKISIVNHTEFLKSEYLPTFNSRAIEINFHRIPGLGERFVYFNDDMFILKSTGANRFYKNGLPRDIFALTAISPIHPLAHVNINNLRIINNHFSKKAVMIRYWKQWLSLRFGIELLKTLLLLPWPNFTGFFDPHQPQPYLKSVFKEVWSKENDVLEQTTSSRFREISNVNPYLFRYWQLVTGKFHPVGFMDSFSTSVCSLKDASFVANIIRKRKYRLLCINDGWESAEDTEFLKAKSEIISAFREILPDKSSFELD